MCLMSGTLFCFARHLPGTCDLVKDGEGRSGGAKTQHRHSPVFHNPSFGRFQNGAELAKIYQTC